MLKRLMTSVLMSLWLVVWGLACSAVPVHSDPARIQIPLIMDETRIYAAAEIWYEDFVPPVTLTPTQVMTSGDKALTLLSQYYFRAKANQVSELEPLYSDSDGSLDAIKRQILTRPSLYTTYSQLETVSVTAKALWGRYQFLPVTLSGAGHSIQWVETLLCDYVKCRMSTTMESMSKDEQIWKNALLLASRFHSLTGHIDPSVFSQMVTTLKLHDKKKELVGPYAAMGAENYPLNIFVHLIDGQDLLVPIEEPQDPIEDVPAALEALVLMIRRAQAVSQGQFAAGMADAWSRLPGDGFFSMTVKPLEPTGSPTDLDTVPHSWDAVHVRIKQWESLRLLAMAHGTEKTYLFVEPVLINGEGTDSIQLFCARRDEAGGGYLLEEDAASDLALEILKSPAVIQFIDEHY